MSPRKHVQPIIILILSIILFSSGLPAIADPGPASPSGTFSAGPAQVKIRVLILSGVKEVRISSPGGLVLAMGGERLAEFPSGGQLRAIAETSFVRIAGTALKGAEAFVSPQKKVSGGFLKVNGITYRGDIKITGSHKRLEVINIVDLESYLLGVVPREMNGNWEMEALKAQAVVARTYALYQMEKNRNEAFDVCCTTNTQVYGGFDSETERSNRAVAETAGMALIAENRPALVYYHANSAGMTEDPINVWFIEVPYLRSRADAFSLKDADLKWSCSFSMGEIRRAIQKNGLVNGQKIAKLGRISDIQIAGLSESGRAKKILIRHGRGQKLYLGSNQFRAVINPAVLKSALFTIKKSGTYVRFNGKGSGHGVGMSQWGAYMMAREGFSFPDILKFYFPGLEIRK